MARPVRTFLAAMDEAGSGVRAHPPCGPERSEWRSLAACAPGAAVCQCPCAESLIWFRPSQPAGGRSFSGRFSLPIPGVLQPQTLQSAAQSLASMRFMETAMDRMRGINARSCEPFLLAAPYRPVFSIKTLFCRARRTINDPPAPCLAVQAPCWS